MSTIKVRVELQRPAVGIEMNKLASLSAESLKLFVMLNEDIGVGEANGTWVARDFYNQGVGFDAEYQLLDVPDAIVASFERGIDNLVAVDARSNWTVPGLRPETVVQAARVAVLADETEAVRFGLYGTKPTVDWRPLDSDRARQIIAFFDSVVEYRGMLQGRIHALYKESDPPFFQLRDFATNALVKCLYQQVDYDKVYRALERKDAAVLVSGWMKASRLDKSIIQLRVEQIQSTKPFDERDLRTFFGSAPGWTGDVTTDRFIDSVRENDDADE